MKKAVSLITAAILSLLLYIPSGALSCNHDYTAEHFDADCLSAERTVHTCKNCGDSYTKYAYEYDIPDSFTFVFESEKDETAETVTLTAKLYGNPGLSIAIMEVAYNSDYLTPVSFTNGTVWNTSEINLGREVNLSRKPLKVYAERVSNNINYENGTYFTFVFKINPEASSDSCGFEFTLRNVDFLNAVTGERFVPAVIDVTEKRNPGSHRMEETVVQPTCTDGGYTVHTCSVCGHTETDTETAPRGHLVTETVILRRPTFTEEGLSVGKCERCDAQIETVIPVLERWKRGDVNNDGKVNALDSLILKKLIVGTFESRSPQAEDAADVNGDGKINALDSYILKMIIVGRA